VGDAMRFVKKILVLNAVYDFFFSYPAPTNLPYYWNFGVYSFFCLIIQIISGIFLAMHYVPDQMLAFDSVEYIMREVQYGWLLRYLHANGASMFFIVVYIHTFRGLYYNSYAHPRQSLWGVGVLILLLMIITAFMGYVLPWGQMSFWAATVITNLMSAIPFIGPDVVIWLWGDYSVGGATLQRFFSLHFVFPFVILALVLVHFMILHRVGSSNPFGPEFKISDNTFMYPYYILKDLHGLLVFFIFFALFLFFGPNLLGHTDNYIPANPMVTPAHIVPEWYLLPYYTILRSIPDKLIGVLALLFSIIVLMIMPYFLEPDVKSNDFKPSSRVLYWIFLFNCLILGWIGSQPAEFPYVQVGRFATFFYFFFWFAIMPIAFFFENFMWSNVWYLFDTRGTLPGRDLQTMFHRMPVDIHDVMEGIHRIPFLHSERI
jgi:ubiquinol-cytochrome c reductase cytochrome b subunit